jgi:hypothetical protein
MVAKSNIRRALATAIIAAPTLLLSLAPTTAGTRALNPQPLPPGMRALNPQPLPPGIYSPNHYFSVRGKRNPNEQSRGYRAFESMRQNAVFATLR